VHRVVRRGAENVATVDSIVGRRLIYSVFTRSSKHRAGSSRLIGTPPPG